MGPDGARLVARLSRTGARLMYGAIRDSAASPRTRTHRDPTGPRRTAGGTVGPRLIGASPVWAARNFYWRSQGYWYLNGVHAETVLLLMVDASWRLTMLDCSAASGPLIPFLVDFWPRDWSQRRENGRGMPGGRFSGPGDHSGLISGHFRPFRAGPTF